MAHRYIVKTLGCKANLYDSQLIEQELQKRGWQPVEAGASEADASLCIVNSCTVTDEADRQTRKMAARLARDNPSARVVVTGCAAEVDPERLTRSKGIHYVVGNRDKPELIDLVLGKLAEAQPATENGEMLGVTRGYRELLSRHPMDREWPTPEGSFQAPPADLAGSGARTRAFLKIQEGCNSFCTYCIIPYARGPSRSLTEDEVVRQVDRLVEEGFREVVVTGTNIGDWGTDFAAPMQFERLLSAILVRTSIERVRVSSLDPTEITPAIFELMARDARFCPHFHVSLQSPHSRILRLMKRRYAYEQVRDCLEKIAAMAAPMGGVFVGMDVITGFPGETPEEFEWTKEALASLPWSRLHVFPYSERDGTPATRLGGVVPQAERQERTRALNELSVTRMNRQYESVLETSMSRGRALESILIEGPARGPDGTREWRSGYTANYLRVVIPVAEMRGHELGNQIVRAIPRDVWVDSVASDVAFVATLA